MPFENLPGISTGGGAITGGAASADGDNVFDTSVNQNTGGIQFGNSIKSQGVSVGVIVFAGVVAYALLKGS